MDNVLSAALKFIFVEILWDLVYFPVWWYTKGLARVVRGSLESAVFHWQRRLALGIWIRSLGKPMYGDTTIEGRIISVFMRLVVLFAKLVSAAVWFGLLIVFVVSWIAVWPLVAYYALYQLFNVSLFGL